MQSVYVTVSEKRGHSVQNLNFQLAVPADSPLYIEMHEF